MKKRVFYVYFLAKDNFLIKIPECLDAKVHKFEPYHYDGKVSDFEDLCQICGLPRIAPDGVYSNEYWKTYKSSERYNGLFEESLRIKRKNGMVS